ncbi:MAG TPA: cytochrome-c oxidase [Planococcus sp. (in: firmicutes)]|nr:cytochrome-c oxidase [Planococcus sp. (in: firmicutes)]
MGTAFVKVAAVYLLIGVGLGIYMGIADRFEFGHAHAHINLLGWATMGLFGLIYLYFARAGNTTLAKVHFWLYNIGTPLVLLGMVLFSLEDPGPAFPIAVVGSLIVLAATLVFVVNVFMNAKEAKTFDENS